ncbi:MAG: hypothetical protein ACI4MV_04300 [Christensenellales bacterium]
MKKSMLLSTIAMIVVVVVALSTATFAWFSSFQDVSATADLTITAADAGIEIRENTGSAWGSWTNAVTMTASTLTAVAPTVDLVAPSYSDTAINAIPDDDAPDFYDAQQTSTQVTVKTNPSADTAYIYKEMQVRVTSTTAKTISLAVTVDGTKGGTVADPSEETKLALNSTKIVVASLKGKSGTAEWVGTTFNYGLLNASAYAANSNTDKLSVSDVVATSEAGGRATALTGLSALAVSGNKITTDDTWASLTNTADDYITIRAWVWIDGHTADNSVKGGDFSVELKFSVVA